MAFKVKFPKRLYKGTFTVKKALEIAERQRKYYSNMIKDPKKKKLFNQEVKKMINKAKKTAISPYNIPRGVHIEYLYYKIVKGYSDEQYSAYLRSLD